MNGKRLVYAWLVALIAFTSSAQPVALANHANTPLTTETNPKPGTQIPDFPQSIPGPLPGPKPTININVNHGYVGQEILVTGVAPSPIYTAVRIAWLFNDTTYTAALANTSNLSYSSTIKVPFTQVTGQARVCAALTNEPAAEFACTAFNLDTPPPGSVSGTLPPGSLPIQAQASIAAPTLPSAFINLTDRAGTVVYSSTISSSGAFSITGVTPGIYGYAFSGSLSASPSAGKMFVEPGKISKPPLYMPSFGYDPVTGTSCAGKFNAQVSWTNSSVSDSSFGFVGDISSISSFPDLFDSTYGYVARAAGKDYDFGLYLEGVSLPVTFRSHLTMGSGITVTSVQYHVQKPDHTIVSLGSSSNAGDNYSLVHNVMDLPVGRSKLIVAPVTGGPGGERQCPTTFTIQVDVDPMKDSRVQAGAKTEWNSTNNWYDFQGTLISAAGLLPFVYPDPIPKLPLLGPLENSFNAGLHVSGDIRLSGLVHIKIAQAIAKAKIFNQSILDKSQDLIDDEKAHIYTDTHDWRNTRVHFVPVELWKDSFSTTVYKGPLASFWGIVTINASLSVGLDGSVTIEGTIYPFQPKLDATLSNKVSPSLTVSIWVDILLGIASAGADGKVAVNFSMPLRLNTDDSRVVWMDTPCFSVKITLSAWARVNLLFYKHTWNIGSYVLLNYSNSPSCAVLRQAVKQAAPEAVLMPPRVMASPAVASSASGEMLSAYVVDTTPAITQTTPTIMASFFDSNLQTWETAMPVSDGLHNVQDPAVAFIGQNQTPIVVWTQTDLTLAQENVAGDDINTYLNKQEIYYRLWNNNSNSWDPAVRLTNDLLPDGRAAISGDPSGATLAWTVNISGLVTATQSLRIRVTDWDLINNSWGTISTMNGNAPNPALNAQVSVARGNGIKALAWTLDTDSNANTNGDRGILACREAATWPTATCDTMGSLPSGSGAESPSLSIDPTTGLLHLAFLVRGKDGDGTSDTGIGNRAMLYSGQADGGGVWSYQALTDHGSPVYAEKPLLLISSTGEESVIFRRFGAAGTNGLLGQLALIHRPAGGNFSNPGYLTDDGSQHYMEAGTVNPGSSNIMLLSVSRAAITPGLAASTLAANNADTEQPAPLAPAAPSPPSQQSTQTLATTGDPVESLALNNQADLALDPNPDISLPHALQGTSVEITITLRNLGLGAALNNNPPIEVCLHNGVPPNGNQLGCQDLAANMNMLNFNDETQFVFTATRTSGLQSFFARVTSNGYNGPSANDIVTGTLGSLPAPLLTGLFADGSLSNAMGVQWMPPGVPGLGGYRLLRSTTPGGPYELVGETSDTYLPDLLLKLGQTSCYVVQAYDDAGILSPNSSEACGSLPLLNAFLPIVRR